MVAEWANQFGSDADFVLDETAHILSHAYLSRTEAYGLLKDEVERLTKRFNYSSVDEFIWETEFLNVQSPYKSQRALLDILEEMLVKEFNIRLHDAASESKKNYVYIDDLLATGSTVKREVGAWLLESPQGRPNYKLVLAGKIRLVVYCVAMHEYAQGMANWAIMCTTDKSINKKILYDYHLWISDHHSWGDQKFNCMMPLETNMSDMAIDYLKGLKADQRLERTYRPNNKPSVETFYSSMDARLRLERIFVDKGVEILSHVNSLKSNHRPLGVTYPSYKTFGTGTMFFTWRNISNTCPIVFWWNNHGWKPLFPLANRGLSS